MNFFTVLRWVIRLPVKCWRFILYLYDYGPVATYARLKVLFSGDISDNYLFWTAAYDSLTPGRLKAIQRRCRLFGAVPVSVIAVLEDDESAASLARAMMAQVHERWELLLVCRRDRIAGAAASLGRADSRIRLVPSHDASFAGRANAGLAEAKGGFVIFARGGFLPRPHALALMTTQAANPDVVMVYADHDRMDQAATRLAPEFKPDWNPDMFLSRNYIGDAVMLRTGQARQEGGLRAEFSGAEIYDLCLRITGKLKPQAVAHIPHILFHDNAMPDAVRQAQAHESAGRAVADSVRARGAEAMPQSLPGTFRVRYPLADPAPLASIIIPTRDQAALLQNCVESLLAHTQYSRFEILIMDNGSRQEDAVALLAHYEKFPNIRVLRHPGPFNFSAINNFAAKQAAGEILLLLNNDTRIISAGWLAEMVSQVLRPEIGAVGARLLYPNGTVQHAGVMSSLSFGVGHVGRTMEREAPGYLGRAQLVQNFLAVTGACMAIRKSVFEEVGGLDENLPVSFNDVDLCLRIGERGYRILWTPHAELIHVESASRGGDFREPRISYRKMQARWRRILSKDPFCNPSLTPIRDGHFAHTSLGRDFRLAAPPTVARPWRWSARAPAR